MPYTKKQKKLFGAELGRLRSGKSTRTGMSEAQLKEGVRSPTLPAKRSSKRKRKRP